MMYRSVLEAKTTPIIVHVFDVIINSYDYQRGLSVSGDVHSYQYRAVESIGQGRLHLRRHRYGEPFAGGGHHRNDHESERRPRHPCIGLRGGERLHQGGKDHPELHRCGQ